MKTRIPLDKVVLVDLYLAQHKHPKWIAKQVGVSFSWVWRRANPRNKHTEKVITERPRKRTKVGRRSFSKREQKVIDDAKTQLEVIGAARDQDVSDDEIEGILALDLSGIPEADVAMSEIWVRGFRGTSGVKYPPKAK